MNESEFYEISIDKSFRFGDVVNGFLAATPNISNPIHHCDQLDFQIELLLPKFCVILSPCCSISDQVISLCPLIQVRNTFFNNPYFEEDLTRINRIIPPEKSIPPEAWEGFLSEQKAERMAKGYAYGFVELFAYEKNPLFPEYTIHRKGGRINTNYYMIDFRNTFRVNCSRIRKPNNVPIESKVLQLSIAARSDLRDKISFYYSRLPDEDLVAL